MSSNIDLSRSSLLCSLVLVFLTFFHQVSAGPNKQTLTYKTGICTTAYASTKQSTSPLPRTTYDTTTHSHTTITSTVTPVTTSTPPTSTFISTEYTTQTVSITQSTNTDTFTTTETDTITQSSTTTTTLTTTESITITSSVQSSTTVPTPAGFTAIQSSNGFGGSSDAANRVKRAQQQPGGLLSEADLFGGAVQDARIKIAAAKAPSSKTAFPSTVACTSTFTLLTMTTQSVTGPTSTVTASAPSTTSTTLLTTISTTTIQPPDATTTTTVYTSTTIINTQTQSTTTTFSYVTTTTSYILPVQTYYAICEDPANYVTEVMGNPIDNVTPTYGYSTYAGPTDAYSCCNACQAIGPASCAESNFLETNPRTCYFTYDSGTCSANEDLGFLDFGNDGPLFNASNGACGYYTTYD